MSLKYGARFEVVKIIDKESGEEQELRLKPLGWKYVRKTMSIARAMFGDDKNAAEKFKDKTTSDEEKGAEFLKKMNDDVLADMQELVLETLKASYPSEPIEKLILIGKDYFMDIFSAAMDLNSVA